MSHFSHCSHILPIHGKSKLRLKVRTGPLHGSSESLDVVLNVKRGVLHHRPARTGLLATPGYTCVFHQKYKQLLVPGITFQELHVKGSSARCCLCFHCSL